MIWLALILAVTLGLLAYSPRTLGRLLIGLSLAWLALAFYSKGGDPEPALAFVPLMVLWGGAFAIAWIFRPLLRRG